MNVEAIDWDNAPDDATHYCTHNELWYKFTSGSAYVSEGYEKNWNLSGFSGNPPDESFIPLPVSSEQPVSAEVETAVSTETHSIEPKPPLGLTPKNLWEEQMQHQRRQDIHAAMQRYIEAGKEIPNNWLEELLELNNAIGIIKAQEVLAAVKQNIGEEMEVEQPDNSNEGWIEWGKEEEPDISDYATVEKVYSDGDTKTGRNSDYKWFGSAGWDGKPYVVVRYRVINEETE